MRSNLTLEAKLAYQRYLDAKTIDDRIAYLEEFLSEVPKHKSTEKIVALNKTRLSKLKVEKEALELRQKALSSAHEDPFALKKEPHALQVLLISDFFEGSKGVGVGKTTLLQNLTGLSNCKPGIFTSEPQIGIYDWEFVKFQVIEEPGLVQSQFLPKILGNIRITDIVALIVDLSQDPCQQINHILKIFDDNNIYLNREAPKMKIEKTGSGGVQIFFHSKEAKKSLPHSDFIHEMVKAYGIVNATIKIYEEVDIEAIQMAFNRKSVYKPAFIIATKADLPNTKIFYQDLLNKYGETSQNAFSIFPVAIFYNSEGQEVRQGLDEMGPFILNRLALMRVYTKSRKGVAEKPLIVPIDADVGQVAQKIHKDLFNTFKFAYVYRTGLNQAERRIRAGLKFKVCENDVIEIFSRV